MECVNCDCTNKAMNNLDSAIRGLLQKGRRVNRMMDNEKLICEAKRREEVEQLKKQIPKCAVAKESMTMDSTMKNSEIAIPPPARTIHNKKWKTAESIDFDIPSLPYESSENDRSSRYTSTSLSIPTKTCPSLCTKSETTTVTSETTRQTIKKSKKKRGSVVLDNQYIVDKDGNLEALPMQVYIKQRPEDGTLDIQFVFFDENSNKVMDVSMSTNDKKISDVQFCGKEVKLD